VGTNKRQAFQLALIVLAFVTGVAWCVQVGRPDVVWALRLGTPLLAAAVGWWFYKANHRTEKLDDLLAKVAPRYHEREGLCFMPVLENAEGVCRMSIYFQNRYAGHASARIEMRPPMRTLGLGRHALPSVDVQIECPGGSFGVLRLPFPVPHKYQGRRMQFDIGADVKYPARRGELLRFRSGKSVGSRGDIGRNGLAALALFSLPLAAVALSRISRVRLTLPTAVSETLPPNAAPHQEILWTAQLPTGGFPVLPVRDAA
jgi:hypothetical protein